MTLLDDRTLLLFFKDFERDSRVRGDRYLKRIVRPLARRFRKRQSVSGFQLWFERLVKALELDGYDVRINDHRAARTNPTIPVGLVGYPHLLDDWDLENPAVLGPCLFDHPEQAPDLLEDPRFRTYLVTCTWMRDLFATMYPHEALGEWYAGIELDDWPDSRDHPKTYDVLVYDKIRFDRDQMVEVLLDPILEQLHRRGLSVKTIRYGDYRHRDFREALRCSRSMLFLCEHETQGMAYQEAMAMNVPIYAWDPGRWQDPAAASFARSEVPTTSVPYFSGQCGRTFSDIDGFEAGLDEFLDHLEEFRPRDFVATHLSFEGSAAAYLAHYDRLRT